MRSTQRAWRVALSFDSGLRRHSFSGSVCSSVTLDLKCWFALKLFLPLQQGEKDPLLFHPISGKFPPLFLSAVVRLCLIGTTVAVCATPEKL